MKNFGFFASKAIFFTLATVAMVLVFSEVGDDSSLETLACKSAGIALGYIDYLIFLKTL